MKSFFKVVLLTLCFSVSMSPLLGGKNGQLVVVPSAENQTFPEKEKSIEVQEPIESQVVANNQPETKRTLLGSALYVASLPGKLLGMCGCGLLSLVSIKNLRSLGDSTETQVKGLIRSGMSYGKVIPSSAKTDDIVKKIGLDPKKVILLEASPKMTMLSPAAAFGSSIIAVDPSIAFDASDAQPSSLSCAAFTPQEKEFLFGHEATHLTQNLNLKLGLAGIASLVVSHYGLKWYDKGVQYAVNKLEEKLSIEKESKTHACFEQFKNLHTYVATSWPAKAVLSIAMWSMVFRYYEKEADLNSAQKLGPDVTKGGISFFEKMRDQGLKVSEDFFGKIGTSSLSSRQQEWIRFVWHKLICSPEGNTPLDIMHPSATDRIAYLKVLLSQQTGQVA